MSIGGKKATPVLGSLVFSVNDMYITDLIQRLAEKSIFGVWHAILHFSRFLSQCQVNVNHLTAAVAYLY